MPKAKQKLPVTQEAHFRVDQPGGYDRHRGH